MTLGGDSSRVLAARSDHTIQDRNGAGVKDTQPRSLINVEVLFLEQGDCTLNAPLIDRSILLRHIRAIEGAYRLTILGVLPPDAAAPAEQEGEIAFLAEKGTDISLMDLVKAEIELSERLGRPASIILKSGLRGEEAASLPRQVQPL